ncbi:speedy protein E4 [Dipodomys merriami]|uniref:speedy protein E4 n=1 Tax=Dipodomys merriami TaxID=94247 RepID=UPI003855A832
MAAFQPSSTSEAQSPQPSGYSSDIVVEEDVPGPSAPWMNPRPSLQRSSVKRKRDWSSDSESEEEPDEEMVQEKEMATQPEWSVEKLCGLKMRFKRRRRSLVLPVHHEVFARLLEDPVVKRFLAWDKKLRVSDKYLLAMVIAYFSRCGLFAWQLRRIHFFLALYLANDMEEDNQAPKQDIFYFLYGKSYAERPMFHKLRYQWIRTMGWNVRVSREECEEIQSYDPDLWVWGRDRNHLS